VVVDVRGSTEKITKREFQRSLAQQAAQKGRRRAPKPRHGGYGKLKDTAIGELLDFAWIKGQAAEMGLGVTSRQIRKERRRLIATVFKSRAEYHRFLVEARYTLRDVRERIEGQMLVTRIQERVGAGLSGRAEERAFSKFVAEYEQRWRARTVCAPEYVFDRCSNGPES
jgi:SurA N-terminal domain